MDQREAMARIEELKISEFEQDSRQFETELQELTAGLSQPEHEAFQIELAAWMARLGGWPRPEPEFTDMEQVKQETKRLQAATHFLRALASLYLWNRLKGWPMDILTAETFTLQIREKPLELGFSESLLPEGQEALRSLLASFTDLAGWPTMPEEIDEQSLSDPIAVRRMLAGTHFLRALEHLSWLLSQDSEPA